MEYVGLKELKFDFAGVLVGVRLWVVYKFSNDFF